MTLEDIRNICLSRPGTTEDRPFGPDTLVFRVAGKMFALTGVEPVPASINLKCDPDDALFFRARFQGVQPGYHMHKQHWNTVFLQSDVPDSLIREMIGDSYELVCSRLPKSVREQLSENP